MARAGKARSLAPCVLFVLLLASCSHPLPEEGTAAAALYRERCGSCHRPVAPSAMKPATWQMILPRMEQRMRATGRPLLAEERAAIEAYVRRNSG